jgi:hypothetical protein
VVGFAIHLDELRLEVGANLREDDLETVDRVLSGAVKQLLTEKPWVSARGVHHLALFLHRKNLQARTG